MGEPLKDMKVALSSGAKPDITHIRTPMKVYGARNCEYGNDKYVRANYLRPVDGMREAFVRYRAYLRATDSHLSQTLDAMEKHQSLDPELKDVEGMKRAAYAVDTDATPGAKVGASFLPHIGGSVASLNMALAQAVDAGLLPSDPGQPWRDGRDHEAEVEIEPDGSLRALSDSVPVTWPDHPPNAERKIEIDLHSLPPGLAIGRDTEPDEPLQRDFDPAGDYADPHDPCTYCGGKGSDHRTTCARPDPDTPPPAGYSSWAEYHRCEAWSGRSPRRG